MAQSVQPPTFLDKLALRLRRYQGAHRLGRWLRRTLLAALTEGFWEFARFFFSKSKFGPPHGVFSVYRALRAQWPPIRGRILLHDQGFPKVTADSLLVQSGLSQYKEQPWPIFWSEHPEASLVTESLALLLPNKTLCVESVYNEGRWRSDAASRYLRLPPPVRLEGNWTSLISWWVPTVGVPVYGHWFHNALPRLGFLPEFPADTRILVPADLKAYHRETLEMMGVWDRCRSTAEQHLIIENYFFSAPTAMMACYDPYGRKIVRDALLPKRDPHYQGPKKFYLHRTGNRRALANGEEICAFFRSKGWSVVQDVELNIAQTIALFADAEAFCSLVGSNMSNAIFCRPGCTVMHLLTDSFVDGWVDWLAQEGELDYHYRVFPVGGTSAAKLEIAPSAIEEFFVSSGVSF